MKQIDHIPLEILETFVRIANRDGDATAAAQELDISQPTISKRLAALRRLTAQLDRQPWLLLKGKRWQLTDEGRRVRGVVEDLVLRYRQMQVFVSGAAATRPAVAIACGQQAAQGFVAKAVQKLLAEQPACQVRISTVRGKDRIRGVAGGRFDLALVTDSPDTIQREAGCELYIEDLLEDRLVLAANPPTKAPWAAAWRMLAENRSVRAANLIQLLFILPEADASRRQQFDAWCHRATGKTVDVVLETGGWQTILDFAAVGIGVGLSTQSACEHFRTRRNSELSWRPLSANDFPPDAIRLIARKSHGKPTPALTPLGLTLYDLLRQSVLI